MREHVPPRCPNGTFGEWVFGGGSGEVSAVDGTLLSVSEAVLMPNARGAMFVICVRTVHFDRHAEALTKKMHCLETLLIVGPTAMYKNAHAVGDEGCLELF